MGLKKTGAIAIVFFNPPTFKVMPIPTPTPEQNKAGNYQHFETNHQKQNYLHYKTPTTPHH
jgi:hypothetical protein